MHECSQKSRRVRCCSFLEMLSEKIRNMEQGLERENSGKVLVLYLDNPGLIHDKEQDPLMLLGVILENRARCKF